MFQFPPLASTEYNQPSALFIVIYYNLMFVQQMTSGAVQCVVINIFYIYEFD